MSVYVLEDIGSRQSMEDTHCVEFNFYDGMDYYSVFDGHGGGDVSTWLKIFHKEILRDKLAKYSDPKMALIETIQIIDEILPEHSRNSQGSTLLVILRKNDRIWCCNIGDCRAIMNRNSISMAIQLSTDHKPNCPGEKFRIEGLGGTVARDAYGTWRVNEYLSLSRAIGDKILHPYVISHPDITTHRIESDNSYIVMASDGLWDVIENELVIKTINERLPELADASLCRDKLPTLRSISTQLLNMARKRNSGDNITLLIILL